MALTLRSPAKLNLFLRVLFKRQDHYHEIASLFQTISLFDDLTFSKSNVDDFTTNDKTLPLDQQNLVIKARDLFRKKTGIQHPVQIHLLKSIPSQAGLGGGSSNAATTLFAMNQLFGANYTMEELAIWSSEIGSDIPFFFSSGLAYCTGRGEKVKDLPIQPKRAFLLGKPASGLSTPEVYRALDIQKVSKTDPQDLLNQYIRGKPHYLNDLEEPALSLSKEIANYKQWFASQVPTSIHLTGSGSTFFTENSDPISGLNLVQTIFRKGEDWY